METTFIVEGMSCGHCVMAVKKELNKVNITDAEVEIGKITLDIETNNTSSEDVIKAVENAGFKVVNKKE
ncbi:MAG TPA: heavy-metal-associated domain-containing protein [Ignavibacteriaceae bacterium]|nr:heavy-metal-associated domain-containing protein [Ignavibacteriaceae bacterium]